MSKPDLDWKLSEPVYGQKARHITAPHPNSAATGRRVVVCEVNGGDSQQQNTELAAYICHCVNQHRREVEETVERAR